MIGSAGRFGLAFTVFASLCGSISADTPHTQKIPRESLHPTLFSEIARQQTPSVVSIMTRARSQAGEVESFFRIFGLESSTPDNRRQRLVGSGFLISASGEILTNSHLVEGADTIEVSLFDNERKRYHAVRIGTDPVTDSALLRLEDPPANLQPVTMGDSDEVQPGDWVMAIGNPFQLGHTVTVGVVSFQGRPFLMENGRWEELIQTDTAITHGNSGGPLINTRGEVIGINMAIVDVESGSVGIGFAMPINSVRALLPQLRQGKVVRGQLGVQFHQRPITDDEARQLGLPRAYGALVRSVDEHSAAERAGMRAGDVVVELDGRDIETTRDLLARVALMSPGTTAVLKLFRDRCAQQRAVTIEEMPVEAERPRSARTPDDDVNGLMLGELTSAVTRPLSIPSDIDGALVIDVAAESAADEAELAIGDVIRRINDTPVRNATEAANELRKVQRRTSIFLVVWRGGTELFVVLRSD